MKCLGLLRLLGLQRGDDGIDNADGELPVGAGAGGELPVANYHQKLRTITSVPSHFYET